MSPFNYAENSPIGNIDLHGLQRVDFHLVGSFEGETDDNNIILNTPISLTLGLDIGDNSAKSMSFSMGSISSLSRTDNQGLSENKLSFDGQEVLANSVANIQGIDASVGYFIPKGFINTWLAWYGADLLNQVDEDNSPDENLANMVAGLAMFQMIDQLNSGNVAVGHSEHMKGQHYTGVNASGEKNLRKMGSSYVLTTGGDVLTVPISNDLRFKFRGVAVYTNESCVQNCDE